MKNYLLLALLLFAHWANAQWTQLNSGTAFNLNEVYFPATDTGYVVGYYGTVLKTVDGGDNWTSQNTGVTKDFNELHFLTTEEGWIVGDSGTVCYTSNGGTNWSCSQVDSGDFVNLHSVWAINSGEILIGGNKFSGTGMGGYLAKSIDGGMSWDQVSMETYIWDVDIKKISMTNVSTGYAATRGYVLKTTDGGMNWSITDTASVHSGVMFVLLEDIATFPNNDTVYTCGWYGGYFGTTTNAASSWQHNENFQNYNLDFLNTQVGYIGGWCQIQKTTDGGATFQDASGGNSPIFCDIYSIDFTDETTGYGVGYGGKILKTTNSGAASLDELSENKVVISPNPTENTIQFSEPSNVQLTSLTGQFIATYHSISTLDLSNQSAGVYLVNILNEKGQIVQRNKIIKE